MVFVMTHSQFDSSHGVRVGESNIIHVMSENLIFGMENGFGL